MSINKIFFYILFLSSLATNLLSQSNKNLQQYNSIADTIIKTAMGEWKGYKILDELCKIGPRLSGSENSYKAIYWAEKKMKELGFDSVWLQPVMVPHWVRGNEESAVINSSKFFKGRKLNISAYGGSIGTEIKNGISAEIIEVKSYKELHERKDEVKGKIVFYNEPFDQTLTNAFAGYGKNVVYRSGGAIEAAKYGAVAVLVRSVTSKNDNITHVGMMRYNDSIPKIPSAAVGIQDAIFLSDALKKESGLKINLKLSCKTFPDTLSYNVIGEIRGTEFPNEIVVVGGHFDSWDKGVGAHDDATGCIHALETVDLFKRLNIKPKRTIRCVFFINEENGVRGGIEYGKWADSSATEKHVALIESDAGGFTPRGFTADCDSSVLKKINSWLPILNKASIYFVNAGGSGVDVSRTRSAKARLGFIPDSQRYMDVHHSDNDVFEAVHPREFELGTAAIAILAYLISEEGL